MSTDSGRQMELRIMRGKPEKRPSEQVLSRRLTNDSESSAASFSSAAAGKNTGADSVTETDGPGRIAFIIGDSLLPAKFSPSSVSQLSKSGTND